MAISALSPSAINNFTFKPANQPSAFPNNSKSLSIPADKLININHLVGAPKAPTREMLESIDARYRAMFTRPVGPPDNRPDNIYAQVHVDGKVVATIYNTGGSEMTNDAFSRIGHPQDPATTNSVVIAQWRAEHYASVLGGNVVKASTALTPSQWEALPPRTYFFDEQAMLSFRRYSQEAAQKRHEDYERLMEAANTAKPQTNIEV